MTQLQDNQSRIKELMAQVRALEEQAQKEAEQKELAKIEAVRSLVNSAESPLTLAEVCETHGITTIAEIAAIFRMRGPKSEVDHAEIERVLHYVRHNPKSTATEIIEATHCSDNTPRRMASKGYLVSWGRARSKRYSVR